MSAARAVSGLLIAAAFPLLLGGSPAGSVVEVRNLDLGGQLVARIPLDSSDSFTLSFTHSMYGGEVAETYRVQDEPSPHLERLAVRTETGGAAEYYARYGNMYQDGEGWVVEADPLDLARLPIRVDRIGQPIVLADGQRIPLLTLLPDGHLAELRPVARNPLAHLWVIR